MVLEPSDDASTKRWGPGWHIPTPLQWEELKEKCKLEEVKENGFWGLKVTGPNGNFIYLPFNRGKMGASESKGSKVAGFLGSYVGVDLSSKDVGVKPRMKEGAANYWTNTLTSEKMEAICYLISAGSKKMVKDFDVVYYGLPIRAVME